MFARLSTGLSEKCGVATYYLDARYLKVGKQLGVDCTVSKAMLNAFYSFHASNAGIAEFWTASFTQGEVAGFVVNGEQVWKTFVLESIWQLAVAADAKFKVAESININELVKKAYDILDLAPATNIAAMVGNDENNVVPDFHGEIDESIPVSTNDQNAMDVDEDPSTTVEASGYVRLVVVDGIVMGPRHCAKERYELPLANAQTGVFCKKSALQRAQEEQAPSSNLPGCTSS
ncbi:hypothetical protein ONZ45_g18805 [Pleurotus djamor]|nr:hypothetical protein ONZ45_g18805 [Pleurotus djamor]